MSQNSSNTTTNHEEIRRWAEARGAKPACVKGTGGDGDSGMIRLDFPGYSGADSLQHISWDEWFRAFDENELALVFQEKTAEGEKSNFNKLVARETAKAREHGDSYASRHHGGSHSSSHSSSQSSSHSSDHSGSQRSHNESAHAASGSSESSDLRSREYRDSSGEVHHHTHPYMEEHRGDEHDKNDKRGGR